VIEVEKEGEIADYTCTKNEEKDDNIPERDSSARIFGLVFLMVLLFVGPRFRELKKISIVTIFAK
jgi:hypothetical protein